MARETQWPGRPSEIWREHHFVIITGSSHSDGYDGTSDHVVYKQFRDRKEWEAEIESMEKERGYSKDYVALEVFPARVERQVHVGVDLSQKV